MASINLQGDTSGSISISAPSVAGSNTLTLPATTQTLATQNALGVRNRIINGDMRIDQRNAGVSVTVTANTYTLDRWFAISPTVSSKYSVIQSSTAPSNFTNSLLITSLSAYTLGASDRCTITQIIEGNMLADLGWGTSSAKTITISFQVRSSLTGTFGGAVQNNTVTRSYPFTYTINSANTWETKTITISGDTTGTWETGTSAGIQLHFGIGVGSTYSGTADAWASADYRSASSVTNILGTSGATFYITGVQLEVGDTATPFEHRPYDMELTRCQRYYEIGNVLKRIAVGNGESDHDVQMTVTKRANPTFTISSQGGVTNNVATNFSNNCVGVNGSGSAYSNYFYNWVAEAEL